MGQVEPLTELESKKRGRPALLSDEVSKDLRLYVEAIRTSGKVVNTAILTAAATGMLQVRDPAALECNLWFTNLRFIHKIIITKSLFPGKSTAITKVCDLGNLRPYGIITMRFRINCTVTNNDFNTLYCIHKNYK